MEHIRIGTEVSKRRLAGGSTSCGARCSSAFKWLVFEIKPCLLLAALLMLVPTLVLGVVTGSISGTVRDASGAVVPGVTVTARNVETGVSQKILTDAAGFYNFPALPIGHYDVLFQKSGFKKYEESGAVINVNTFLRIDALLQVGTVTSTVTVQGTPVAVNTRNAQLGEVIEGSQIVNLPLNGRAYTDLLALQPGVVPINVTMYGNISPSANLDNGELTMNGQRDVENGFMLNGANAEEDFFGGTVVVPNLDSIAEFRIITSNAGAEYGNYSGGQVNVVTKSGTNQFHGDAFDFLRNSSMDSRNFFSPSIGTLRQNMFGGTFGGPIVHDKAFFFVDYQGTRNDIGVDTGLIAVPSQADRNGDFSDEASSFYTVTPTGTIVPNVVSSPYFANILGSKLGYPVAAGEAYYTPGCTSSASCVFPNAVIPQRAWSPVSPHVISLIPLPNAGAYFSTSANPQTLQDDKGGIRVDGKSRFGMLSAYYHDDPWVQTIPYASYPGGGSTVPGFPSMCEGKAQMLVVSDISSFGSTAVNQFTFSYFRNKNISGFQASGPTLASLGFALPDQGGPEQLGGAQYQNWPTFAFENYGLGAGNTIERLFDNTYQWQDDFTKIAGTHTVKFGADYHLDQADQSQPNNGSIPAFCFDGSETGIDFADMLIGAPSGFGQGAPAEIELRNYYIGVYGEDSWRVTPNLTFNYGLRWDVTPWPSDSRNRLPDLIAGEQSQTFPGAPKGYVFPGDPGVPRDLAYPRYNDLGPRLGVAYAPRFSGGPLAWLFGSAGKSSIRAGYGLYYNGILGRTGHGSFASPPYGLFYSSPAQPLLAQPFIARASGVVQPQPFPLPAPPTNASPSNPDTSINWAPYVPIIGARSPLTEEKTPYGEHLDFSIQRQIEANTLLSLSYVGSFGHHLMGDLEANTGNPALCLGVSKPGEVLPGTPTCGPFGENGVYYPITGGVINGTRAPFGPNFGNLAYYVDRGNSDYNALEVTLHHTSARSQFLVSYTFSKAMDDGSGFGDQYLPSNMDLFYSLSRYDMTHNFVASYTYELPFDRLFHTNDRLTRGWKVSGITEFSTGIPIQISDQGDGSLLGTGASPENGGTDVPDFTPGPILQDTNPRDRKLYFNTSLFSKEPLGEQGTASRRFFHGPGINNWDLALFKDVRITESKTLELRGEFFNAFNHAQFYGRVFAQGNFLSSQFGYINHAASPRIGQVAIKFMF
ncbi:MAG: TonB-dependent receptor domain-containing protein [Terriglobia bacterium]